jgi:hypothetical protein
MLMKKLVKKNSIIKDLNCISVSQTYSLIVNSSDVKLCTIQLRRKSALCTCCSNVSRGFLYHRGVNIPKSQTADP